MLLRLEKGYLLEAGVSGVMSTSLSGNVALGVTLQSDLEGILNLKAFSCRYDFNAY